MCDRNSAVLEENSSTASVYAVSVLSVPCGLTPSLNLFHICFAPQFPYSGAEIVLVSGMSFSFDYAALIPFRKSVPFGTICGVFASPYHSTGHCLIGEVPLSLFAPLRQSRGS